MKKNKTQSNANITNKSNNRISNNAKSNDVGFTNESNNNITDSKSNNFENTDCR